MELLAWPQPRVDDVDRSTRLGYERTGDVRDLHWAAHVQHQDLARAADGAGLNDQLNRLADGHEEPGHLRVSDRDRAAGLDLALKRGEHRASASHNVPETDAHVRVTAIGAVPRRDPLGDGLGVPEHTGGVGGLVRRDVHEALHAVLLGQLEQAERAPHVRLDRL